MGYVSLASIVVVLEKEIVPAQDMLPAAVLRKLEVEVWMLERGARKSWETEQTWIDGNSVGSQSKSCLWIVTNAEYTWLRQSRRLGARLPAKYPSRLREHFGDTPRDHEKFSLEPCEKITTNP